MLNDHLRPDRVRQQTSDAGDQAANVREDEQDRGFTEGHQASAESARNEAEAVRQLAEEAREERERLREARERERAAREEVRVAEDGACRAAMDAVHATATELQVALDAMRAIEDMRRMLSGVTNGHILDSN